MHQVLLFGTEVEHMYDVCMYVATHPSTHDFLKSDSQIDTPGYNTILSRNKLMQNSIIFLVLCPCWA